MNRISFWKKTLVFAKNNGRILVGGVMVAVIVFVAIFAPYLTDQDPNATDIYNSYQDASEAHPMGTDHLGRDIQARVIYGSRASLIIALVSASIGVVVGAVLGLLCGFYAKIDMLIMRILEAISSLPTILTVFVISAVLGDGYFGLITALVIATIPGTTRYVRAQVMSIRQREFVEREIAMGASTLRIMFYHVLPQCTSYLLVSFGAGLGGKIMSLATLSFLGVGLPEHVPNWGTEIAAGSSILMLHPWNVFYPIIAVAITAFGFSMLGDGLRDLLDPTTK